MKYSIFPVFRNAKTAEQQKTRHVHHFCFSYRRKWWRHDFSKGYPYTLLSNYFPQIYRCVRGSAITNAPTNNRAACHLEFIQPVKVEIRRQPDCLCATLSKSGKRHGWVTERFCLLEDNRSASIYRRGHSPLLLAASFIKWYTGPDAEHLDTVPLIRSGAHSLI